MIVIQCLRKQHKTEHLKPVNQFENLRVMRKPQRVSEMYNSKLASTLSAIKSILEITKYIKLQVTSSSSFKFVTKCFFYFHFLHRTQKCI